MANANKKSLAPQPIESTAPEATGRFVKSNKLRQITRGIPAVGRAPSSYSSSQLGCPTPLIQDQASVIDELVPSLELHFWRRMHLQYGKS